MQRRQFIQLGALGLIGLHFPEFVFGTTLKPFTLPDDLKTNLLLDFSGLPKFSQFKPEFVKPAVDFLLAQCREVTTTVSTQEKITWDNFFLPLAEINDKLDRAWAVVNHLKSVKNTPELRKTYDESRKNITEYSTWVGQNPDLYKSYVKLKESADFAKFSIAQQKSVEDALLDFKL